MVQTTLERVQEVLESAERHIRELQKENAQLRSLIGLDYQRDVTDFHYKFGQYVGATPALPPIHVQEFRHKLIDEEIVRELLPAIEHEDLPQIADGIVDGIYVLQGTAVSYGIQIAPIWAKVHAYNMGKIPVKSANGDMKPLKPEGYPHPDITRELMLQALQGEK